MVDITNFSKWIILFGIGIAFCGMIIWVMGKLGVPFGQMPGDVRITQEKFSFYFPIVTSIAISLAVTILMNMLFWWMRK